MKIKKFPRGTLSKPTVAVTSQANHMVAACTYCMQSKVSSLSQIYLYSNYFDLDQGIHHRHLSIYMYGINIESLQNRLLKVCYVPATSAGLNGLLFSVAINNTNEANKAGGTHR